MEIKKNALRHICKSICTESEKKWNKKINKLIVTRQED